MGHTNISAADALKHFGKTDIKVQTVKLGKDKKPMVDPEKKTYVTEMQPLAEEHVHGAKDLGDGRVSITTIDGRRHVADKIADKK